MCGLSVDRTLEDEITKLDSKGVEWGLAKLCEKLTYGFKVDLERTCRKVLKSIDLGTPKILVIEYKKGKLNSSNTTFWLMYNLPSLDKDDAQKPNGQKLDGQILYL